MDIVDISNCNKKSGVYLAVWEGTNYIYVGQSINLYKRVTGHLRSIKNGVHDNRKILSVSRKYGLPKFYVLEFCERDNLNKVEQKYLDIYFDNYKNCLNILKIAGSSYGHKMPPRSKETRDKLSNSLRGRKFSKEHRERLSLANKGKKITKEQLEKMLSKVRGVKKSKEARQKLSKALKGRIFSKEHRINIGKTKIGNTYVRGQKRNKEQLKRMSNAQKERAITDTRFADLNINRRKAIIQLDMNDNIIKEYESITDAGRHGFGRKEIGYCIKGIHKHHKGFKWRLKND